MGRKPSKQLSLGRLGPSVNAVIQVFENALADQIEKVILTASGGPFRSSSKEEMANVTPEQALKHPNWDMDARNTIDSASMMNK